MERGKREKGGASGGIHIHVTVVIHTVNLTHTPSHEGYGLSTLRALVLIAYPPASTVKTIAQMSHVIVFVFEYCIGAILTTHRAGLFVFLGPLWFWLSFGHEDTGR